MLDAILYRIARLFRPSTATELALAELAQARKSLLQAQSNREYYDAMVACLTARIKRLEHYTREGRS